MKYSNTHNAFGNYVRSSSFVLTLSEPCIDVLLKMLSAYDDCIKHDKDPNQYGHSLSGNEAGSLTRRGLVVFGEDGYVPTKEGIMVARLLIMAGYAPPDWPSATMFPSQKETNP